MKPWAQQLRLFSQHLEIIYKEIGLLGHELSTADAKFLAFEASIVQEHAAALVKAVAEIVKNKSGAA
jgi:hypothetical protein